MPSEIEAKIRVDSHKPVRDRLRECGAEPLGLVVETNRIFDRPDGSLRRRGCGLRVRSTVAEGGGEQSATLTFKRPVAAGPYKSREELETPIGDAETAVKIISAMGFIVILSYQKRRESWRLGKCRIELDEPPHIGLFVEIEGPDEGAIRKTQRELGLEGAEHVKPSYPRMLLAYCNEHGIVDRTLGLLDVPDGRQ